MSYNKNTRERETVGKPGEKRTTALVQLETGTGNTALVQQLGGNSSSL